YAANMPAPLRTFTVPAADLQFAGFAIGYDRRIYLARPDGFESYPADSDGCCPSAHIVTDVAPSNTKQSFAVGPDGSIYAVQLVGFHTPNPPPASTMYVNVYPPGSGKAARRIGPLPVDNGALANAPVVAVDAKSRLYVSTMGNVYRFGPHANGNATPQRIMTPPASYGRIIALAIGP
ncbi:MAG: hypothetical protein JOZ24_02835, partial [Candidatus Eremiobacteraeota bacterium]|nr:hypothetical protein [Candidatus Eremiobacteraeota bacterium]